MKPQKGRLRDALVLLTATIVAFSLYKVLLLVAERTDETFYSFAVFVLYAVLLLGFALAYLIYNRFFYRKGITREQLPDDWDDAAKDAFLADGEARLARSRWMLFLIFPLLFTFLMDAVDLFLIDPFFR